MINYSKFENAVETYLLSKSEQTSKSEFTPRFTNNDHTPTVQEGRNYLLLNISDQLI